MDNLTLSSLFNTDESEKDTAPDRTTLDIIPFTAKEKISYPSWQKLFTGYKSLKMITFSSSISMIKEIVQHYDNVEIIFGNETVLGSIETLLKEQYASIKLLQDENFKSGNTFLSRIADGTLSFYVTKLNDYTSHQKVYLLSNDEEKKYRTITGSANFSYQAFRGNQFETIMVADDFQTYDIFYNLYLKTKEYSTQEITEKTLKELDLGHMDELPAVKEVVTAKTVEITMPKEADQYALKQEEFQKFVNENNLDIAKDLITKKDKATLITYTKMKKVLANFKAALDKKKKKYVSFPVFYVDKSKGTMYLNDQPLDLTTITSDAIDKDVQIFQEFFNGYFDPSLQFRGDLINNVRKYYATVNYCFCAPFLSICRYETLGTNIEVIPYPMFLLLKGTTNAGKSMLMKFILKLCFNPYDLNIDRLHGLLQKADTLDNAPAKLQAKIAMMQGMPLMIDEVSSKRWKEYGDRFIKTDIIEQEHLSPVIMASNDIKEIDEALSKRTVAFDIDITIPRISNLQKKTALKHLNNCTGALYKEYLRRMLEKLPAFLQQFHDETKKESPDLLKLSSQVLLEILQESLSRQNIDTSTTNLSYLDVYDMKFYLIHANDHEKISDFIDLYEKVGDEWDINRKADTIRIKFENQYEARDFQRKYGLELADWQGRNIIMPLKKTEAFFGIQIGKKGFFDKVKSLWES